MGRHPPTSNDALAHNLKIDSVSHEYALINSLLIATVFTSVEASTVAMTPAADRFKKSELLRSAGCKRSLVVSEKQEE